jgi:hypothetical protein
LRYLKLSPFRTNLFSNKRLSCKQISSLLLFFLPKRFPFDLFYSWNFFANKRDSNFSKYFLRGLDLSTNKNPFLLFFFFAFKKQFFLLSKRFYFFRFRNESEKRFCILVAKHLSEIFSVSEWFRNFFLTKNKKKKNWRKDLLLIFLVSIFCLSFSLRSFI